MTDSAEQDLQATIRAWDQAAWSLAALALAAQGDGPPELTAAAWELRAAAGLFRSGARAQCRRSPHRLCPVP